MERLITRQAKRQRLARSTIQEKFSGASSLNFPQALSIIEAIAEYARENNIPLPAREVDPETWRKRIVAAASIEQTQEQLAQPSDNQETSQAPYDIEPLRQAEMHDLVELVLRNKGNPPAIWLPSIIQGMLDAEMTVTGFLKRAATESPLSVVQTLRALEDEFPYSADSDIPWEQERRGYYNTIAVGQLIRFAAHRHGASASPAIVVGLRRQRMGHHVEDFLSRVASWNSATDIEKAAAHLKAAELQNDTGRLLRYVGAHRPSDRVVAVIRHFWRNDEKESIDAILTGIGASSKHHLQSVTRELKNAVFPDVMLHKIAKAIDYGKHEEYAQHLDESGLGEMAEIVRKYSDELPF
ncbi:hypothetical protein [Streptomyces sp. NPDC057284]|uniref:hypothetical protein n=1 Tax=Streptomyces sp. NPDC057284 TaxID=3346083 RepID=UPI00363B22DB